MDILAGMNSNNMNWYKTSQKAWTRSNWIIMLEKAFELIPHSTAGTFHRWTEPYLGRVSFMNDREDIRTELAADLYPFRKAQIGIFVSTRDGQSDSEVKSWSGEDFKTMPYDIVKEVYRMIDGFSDDDDDDDFRRDKDYPNTPSPNSHVEEHSYAKSSNTIKLANQKKLILARGVSGSGKSTLAQELGQGGTVFSTDEFFMRNGNYQFDPDKIQEAHQWNQKRTEQAMQDGLSPIVIDNTNLRFWEMKPYVETAQKYGYSVEFAEPDWHPDLKDDKGRWNFDFLKGRNVHDVPDDVLQEMINSYEHNPTVDDVLRSKRIGDQ